MSIEPCTDASLRSFLRIAQSFLSVGDTASVVQLVNLMVALTRPPSVGVVRLNIEVIDKPENPA